MLFTVYLIIILSTNLRYHLIQKEHVAERNAVISRYLAVNVMTDQLCYTPKHYWIFPSCIIHMIKIIFPLAPGLLMMSS